MRPARLILALTLAVTLASCGGGGPSAESPLDEALSHLPENAPLAIIIETDPDSDQAGAIGEIADKFPFGGQAFDSLRKSIEREGVDYEEDVKPLLGNAAVIGVPDVRTLTGDSEDEEFVLVMETNDADKLEELAKKGTKESGEIEGAKVYDDDGTLIAVRDDVFVLSQDRGLLEQALKQRQEDDRLREEQVEDALEGLDEEGIVRLYADLEQVLKADPGSKDALKVKWVAALRTLGMSLTVADDEIEIAYLAKTEPEGLDEEDLPLAGGSDTPAVVGNENELAFGVNNLGQIGRFALNAAQAIDPQGLGVFRQQAEGTLGIDLERDILEQFTGDASIAVDLGGKFAARSEVADPARLERTLADMADKLPDAMAGVGQDDVGIAKPGRGEDFYGLSTGDGDTIVFGVVDEVFVIGTDPERAGEIAAESPRAVDGAEGSFVMTANAESIANSVLEQFAGSGLEVFGGSLFTGPLGDLTSWAESSEDGIEGRLRLTIE